MSKNTIVYRIEIPAKVVDGSLQFEIDDVLSLSLGLNWVSYAKRYFNRSDFYWDMSVTGHGEGALPILESTVEIKVKSLTAPVFNLELSAMPSKLEPSQRLLLEQLVETNLDNQDFKVCWESDYRGPRKRSAKVKRKLLDKLKSLPQYDGSDNLKPEDIQVTLSEALNYFEFNSDNSTKDKVKDKFKSKLKSFQLKAHPDSPTGSEEAFLYLQKCKLEVLSWLKR